MSVDQSWSRITGWLSANAPVTASAIRPPAAADQLGAARAAFALPWPEDLVRLYELCDGFDVDGGGQDVQLFGLERFASLASMLRHRKVIERVWESYDVNVTNPEADPPNEPAGTPFWGWLPSLVPFGPAMDANVLVVDLRGGDQSGCVCEWRHDDPTSLFPPGWGSVGALLADLADALETGNQFGRSSFVEVEDGRLDWDFSR